MTTFLSAMRRIATCAGLAALLATSAVAASQTFPRSSVKIIVPYPPGAPVDAIARSLGEALSAVWKQPVVIDNKTGALEIVAGSALLQSQPDGHTIMFATESSYSLNTFLFSKLPFDPTRDFIPITRAVRLNMALVIRGDLPAKTVSEFVSLMKKEGANRNYGSAGTGHITSLYMEELKKRSGFELLHVPYRGIAPIVPDMLGGTIDAMLAGVQIAVPHVKTGKMRVLAISGKERARSLPDVPTFSEAGMPDYEPTSYLAFLAPRGTPKDVVAKIAADVSRILQDRAFIQKVLEPFGFEPMGETPEQFTDFVARDRETSKARFQPLGIRLD